MHIGFCLSSIKLATNTVFLEDFLYRSCLFFSVFFFSPACVFAFFIMQSPNHFPRFYVFGGCGIIAVRAVIWVGIKADRHSCFLPKKGFTFSFQFFLMVYSLF